MKKQLPKITRKRRLTERSTERGRQTAFKNAVVPTIKQKTIPKVRGTYSASGSVVYRGFRSRRFLLIPADDTSTTKAVRKAGFKDRPVEPPALPESSSPPSIEDWEFLTVAYKRGTLGVTATVSFYEKPTPDIYVEIHVDEVLLWQYKSRRRFIKKCMEFLGDRTPPDFEQKADARLRQLNRDPHSSGWKME